MSRYDEWDERAEADANMLSLREQRAAEIANRSEHQEQWAAYARKRLRDASPVAAAIIDRGPQSAMREWNLMAVARRQLAEDRAARIALEPPANDLPC